MPSQKLRRDQLTEEIEGAGNNFPHPTITDFTYTADPSTVTTIKNMVDPDTGEPSTLELANPVASATQAGEMNAATYQSMLDMQAKVNAIENGSVAVSGLSATPSQSDLTTAWQTETGLTDLINSASIWDITNTRRWEYFTNTSQWTMTQDGSGGTVTILPFTNTQAGIILGSTRDGQLSAETDGTGSLNGWDNTQAQLTTNTANIASNTTALGSKVDKVTTTTANPQVYTKNADGTQGVTDSSSTSPLANTVAVRTGGGQVKVAAPTAANDATPNSAVWGDNTQSDPALPAGDYSLPATWRNLLPGLYKTNTATTGFPDMNTNNSIVKLYSDSVYTKVIDLIPTGDTGKNYFWRANINSSTTTITWQKYIGGTTNGQLARNIFDTADPSVGTSTTRLYPVFETSASPTAGTGFTITENQLAQRVSKQLGMNYSTSEVNTNTTWIDGKTIYKKTINFGALPNTTSKNIAHGVTGITQVVSITGIAKNGTAYRNLPMVHEGGYAAANVFLGISGANITAACDQNMSAWTAYITIEYTK
jgi:hypothetical protein